MNFKYREHSWFVESSSRGNVLPIPIIEIIKETNKAYQIIGLFSENIPGYGPIIPSLKKTWVPKKRIVIEKKIKYIESWLYNRLIFEEI